MTLLGLTGIGKSSIARNALHFMAERKFFTGGVILMQLKNVKDIYALNKQIYRLCYQAFKLNKEEINDLIVQTPENQIEILIKFFNSVLPYKYKK